MSLANKDNTLVILPVYNSAGYLWQLVNEICEYIPIMQIVAIDDGSTDNSYETCKSIGIHCIRFKTNQGKGAALKAGFAYGLANKYEFALTIDSDLQHSPKSIPRFFRKQNYVMADLIIGKRNFSLTKMPFMRVLSNTITSKVVSLLSGQKVYDSQCGYRLYRLERLRNIEITAERYQYETAVILELSKELGKIDYVTIDTIYNDEISYINSIRDIKNFVEVIFKHI
ncbi:MAG: glycosyltransferase family 2 protein [Candidatus Cloacimonadales bacterium]|mgnify:CR=1 FL=1|nr:glycosyltransferase family 2 protein [Candidatus Cloacimonadota bacterium]MDD2649658.1 glycosyltransferase family 2 protein [Candidatus Cloacimonadota bacterium]MDD3501169.1 glycosyltransferase family 2 protein [Candidatus Cloacimonadota bacterium]MDX9976937.1 glycosyltransferase family 2 protein [Candidatus Cloacimonadales bacterium]